jgi:hypothetical protein
MFLLPEVSIPVFIIFAVQYFKANLAALRHHHLQGSFNNDTLTSLVIIRRLDSLLSRILIGVGVISSQLVVGMVVLMARYQYFSYSSWNQHYLTDICLYVCLMALFFGAFSCLLVIFFICLRPRQKKDNVVVETAATDEHTTHHQVLLEPLLGQVDTPQNSESITLLVV